MFSGDAELYVQPIYSLKNYKVTYAEVLTRVINKYNDLNNLFDYIMLNNLHLEYDLYILNIVCGLITKMNLPFKIAVNVFSRTIETGGIYKDIIKILRMYNIGRGEIVIEVNENTNLANKDVIANISKLKRDGVGIAIDDYGTGKTKKLMYSSLGLLDIVKFFHSYNMDTIIEGVETQKDLIISNEIGFKNVQGFLLCEPFSINKLFVDYNYNPKHIKYK